MWTNVALNLTIVWDDALWRMTAIWQESAEDEPVMLEKSGRVSLSGDTSPRNALKRAVAALDREVQPEPPDQVGA
jgi:hypothetical protein